MSDEPLPKPDWEVFLEKRSAEMRDWTNRAGTSLSALQSLMFCDGIDRPRLAAIVAVVTALYSEIEKLHIVTTVTAKEMA